MITGELTYIPWLNKTEIRFNGKKPGINSHAEKLRNSPLSANLDLLPQLFEEELNGPDFCLYFSGPELDFEEVRKAFLRRFKDTGQTQIVQKRKLSDRSSKTIQTDALFKWICESRIPDFDLEAFARGSLPLLSQDFRCVLIGCRLNRSEASFMGHRIVLDSCLHPDEMTSTNLYHVPLCYFICPENIPRLSQELMELLERKDVDCSQLYFIWDKSLNLKRMNTEGLIRRITDLGIENPVFVSDPLDPKVQEYLELYAMTDYLQNSIAVLDGLLHQIRSYADEQNQKFRTSNQILYDRIADTEQKIETESSLLYWLDNQDQLYLSDHASSASTAFLKKIADWKKKKDQACGEQEGQTFADEFQSLIEHEYAGYQQYLSAGLAYDVQELASLFNSKIGADGLNGWQTQPDWITLDFPDLPDFRPHLLEMYEMCTVHSMEDVFQRFLGQQPKEQSAPLFDLRQWRTLAGDVLKQVTDHCEEAALQYLREFQSRQCLEARQYILRQSEFLQKEKQNLSSRLSSEEQILQVTIDWTRELETKMVQLREEAYE